MSLRYDASTDQLRGVTPSSITNFTIIGRAYVVSNRGAGTIQSLVDMPSSLLTDVLAYLSWNDGASGMEIGSYDGTNSNFATFSSRPAVGQWFWYYLRCSGSGAGALQGGFMLDGSDTITTQTSTLTATAAGRTPVRIDFSSVVFSTDWLDARNSHMRAWNAVLTDSEIRLEFNNNAAVRTANLIFDTPADQGSVALSLLDYSGNNNPLTQSGTAVEVDGPIEDILHPQWGYLQVGGAQSINVGLNTETDSAFSTTWKKSKSIGLNTETDTSQAVGRSKSRTAGLNAEADSAFTLSWIKSRAVGLNTEADSSLAVTRRKSTTVGLPQETDSALTTTRRKSRTVGLSTESDSVLALAANKRRSVSQVVEADTALPLTGSQSIDVGIVVETDSVFGITRTKRRSVGLLAESDSALAIRPTRLITVAQAVETDSVFSVGRRKSKLLGQTTELDTALPVEGGAHLIGVGMVVETELALPIWFASGSLIDGQNQLVLDTPYATRTLYNNGTGNYFTIN